jgi:hypothetical protein
VKAGNSLHVDERVRLKTAVPELGLRTGDEGLVCSIWFAPARSFEVEFGTLDFGPIRVLVGEEELEAAQHN